MSDAADRLERLEMAIFGDGGSNMGVLAKLGKIEIELAHTNRTLESINGHIAKIVWIILGAVIVAMMGLVLRAPAAAGNSASISVGASESVVDSGRGYLTVAEVAAKEGKAERTILDWIEAGRVEPMPVKSAKSWVVAADYRILPHFAEGGGGE